MNLDKIPITEEDKANGMKAASEMVKYLTDRKAFDKKVDWMLKGIVAILLIGTGIVIYLLTKSPASTERDVKMLQADRQQLINQRKFFAYDKEEFQKEKEIFVRLKFLQDSSNAVREANITKLMANIFKQDSIAKLKNVIKADVVNAKTVNTVNTKSVNVNPKK